MKTHWPVLFQGTSAAFKGKLVYTELFGTIRVCTLQTYKLTNEG